MLVIKKYEVGEESKLVVLKSKLLVLVIKKKYEVSEESKLVTLKCKKLGK